MRVFPRVKGAPWYRELNIMNSNPTKDFVQESCSHPNSDTFSDVFPPASSMQWFSVPGTEPVIICTASEHKLSRQGTQGGVVTHVE